MTNLPIILLLFNVFFAANSEVPFKTLTSLQFKSIQDRFKEPKQCEILFSLADQNMDGKVSQNEFDQFVTAELNARFWDPSNLLDTFKTMDQNGDGMLSDCKSGEFGMKFKHLKIETLAKIAEMVQNT